MVNELFELIGVTQPGGYPGKLFSIKFHFSLTMIKSLSMHYKKWECDKLPQHVENMG